MIYNFIFKRNPVTEEYVYDYHVRNGELLNLRRIHILHLFCVDCLLPNKIRKLFPEQLVVSNILKYYLTDDYIVKQTRKCFKLSCKKINQKRTEEGRNPFSKQNMIYDENGKSILHNKVADIKRLHDSFNLSKKNRKRDSDGIDLITKKLRETNKMGYRHHQRKLNSDGKDIAMIKCNQTRNKNGTQPFSKDNETRKRLNDAWIKKFGTASPAFGFWKRTEFNNNPSDLDFYISDDMIEYHNTIEIQSILNKKLEKNRKLYGTASPGGGYWKETEYNQDSKSKHYISKIEIDKHNFQRFTELQKIWSDISILKTSKGELLFVDLIKELNFDVITQYHIKDYELLKNYFCDVFIPSLNLIVEIDGDYKWDLDHHLLYPWLNRSQRIKEVSNCDIIHILTNDAYYYKDHLDELREIILHRRGEIEFKSSVKITEESIKNSLYYFAGIRNT